MAVRANVVLGVVVGVMATAAVVAAVVAVQRDAVVLDAGSPEATVQTYVAAIAADDLLTAVDQLAPESDCGIDDLAAAYLPESLEVVLHSTEVDGTEAVVTVKVTDGYGEGPFTGSGYTHAETLVLRQVDGQWLLTGTPWPMYGCQGGAR